MPYAPPDVPSQYMNYDENKGSNLRPKANHFHAALSKAKTILSDASAAADKGKFKQQSNKEEEKKETKKWEPPGSHVYVQPRIPTMPEYDSYRTSRMEILMERGAVLRQKRVKHTMSTSSGFLHDKRFLEMMLGNSARTKADHSIRDISQETLSFIEGRYSYQPNPDPPGNHSAKTNRTAIRSAKNAKTTETEIQTQKNAKTTGTESSKSAKKRPTQADKTASQANNAVDTLVKELEGITQMMTNKEFEKVVEATKKLVVKINSLEFKGKPNLLSSCSCILGTAYLELKDEKKALAFHLQDLKISTEANLQKERLRALENLGRVYSKTGQYQKTINIYTEKLELQPKMSSKDRMWIYHELGYCYLNLENHEKALEFGEKSYMAANKVKDAQWRLNASMLVAQAVMASGDTYACKKAFEKALESAKAAGDVQATETIKETLREIEAVMEQFRVENASRSSMQTAKPVTQDSEQSGQDTENSGKTGTNSGENAENDSAQATSKTHNDVENKNEQAQESKKKSGKDNLANKQSSNATNSDEQSGSITSKDSQIVPERNRKKPSQRSETNLKTRKNAKTGMNRSRTYGSLKNGRTSGNVQKGKGASSKSNPRGGIFITEQIETHVNQQKQSYSNAIDVGT